MKEIQPFGIDVADATLRQIRERVARYPWHEMPDGKRVEVPTAVALFPGEMLAWPPRSYVERVYNVTHWSEMSRGGHFAALEQPQILISDLRSFARSLR